MKFMSWSLNAPSNYYFDNYIQKTAGGWQVVDPDAINSWSGSQRNMFQIFEKYHNKVQSFGMHEFGVNPDGTIYDYITENQDSGERMGDRILSSDNNSIVRWVKRSLQYLMDTYPDVRFAIQMMNFQGSGEIKLNQFLDDTTKWDTCLQEVKRIAELYIQEGYPIADIEVDFERASNRDGDAEKYADFLKRVKNEICIPLGLSMRVNMYSMTGDFVPQYYGWHDYKTLASRNDYNGNQAVDEFQLMTYDFAWAGSAPGPSTPQWWLKEVMAHAVDSLPPDKTWIGNAGYGRRWGLDNQQRGYAVSFNEITMWQNGMYIHTHGNIAEDQWIWHDQDWLPFTGSNDINSGYQITYPHLYDKFSVPFSDTLEGEVNRTTFGGFDIVTSYLKSQQPIFTGVQAVANSPSTSGNTSGQYLTGGEDSAGYHFPGAYRPNRAQYQYDEPTASCVPVPDDTGKDGNATFQFNMSTAGNYRLLALVNFNTLDSDTVNATLNGIIFTVGGTNIEDWFPFYIDKSVWIDVGAFDFQTSNTINIGISKGYIWGFVVCENFDQRFLGGQVGFDSNLIPFNKRDTQGNPVQADMPMEMTITGEILRRPPRPAIVFEDIFIYMLSTKGAGYNITNLPYYMTTQEYWNSGEIERFHEGDQAYACTDSQGFQMIGFTDGDWILQDDGSIKASANTGYSSQLVLYKKFSANMKIRADVSIIGTYPKAGIRMLASREGDGNEGYLALLDYQQNKVVFGYEDGSSFTELTSEWMSPQLQGLKGSRVSIYATIMNDKVYVQVGDRTYIDGFLLSTPPNSGAYGVYVSDGTVNLTMFNVSTIDRHEPLEKMQVEVEGIIYDYGEIDRGLSYDKYGYLIYTGLSVQGLASDNPGGSASLDFDEDYSNVPLARHPSWVGAKQIKVRMVDAGIWFKNLYIGDSEGYSVAYNSDYIGFIETVALINQYKFMGVAMWTMGQEDPLIYTYLPEA